MDKETKGKAELTDEQLMLAYAADDMEAFTVLYQRHKNRVFGFLMRRLKDQTESEEVFQTIFTKLHLSRGTYRQQIPFLAWLFTIARNAIVDHVRKKGSYRKHITTSEEAVAAYAQLGSTTSPGNIALKELSSLSAVQRQALDLRFGQGLTFQEISEQIQMSENNSRQIISRAIRKLRKLIAGKERSRDQSRE
jgi:RNA polymerase sigma-70 factor (ECF subfamily)